jgi:glycerol-3-phosphate dehydrogenase
MLRGAMLERIRTPEPWDLIVIGGGATGLGAAVDAASRGYRTLLIEAFDFAKGTSSRSTKLAHGGVRYLKQGNIGLVREGLHERGLMRRNAPHLVRTLPFVIPSYRWWSQPFYGIGLLVYDRLAGKLGLGATRIVTPGEALRRVPTLRYNGLWGGIVYYDGQFDDARLAIALLRTFLDLGGAALNYLPATGFTKQGGRIAGVQARDAETGEEFTMRARGVVNATGAFADSLRQLDEPQTPALLALSQGTHLVLPRSFLPGDSAVMIPRTDDGRVLFAIPWHDRALIGTTDTRVTSISAEPRPLPEETEFLLEHTRRYFSRPASASDVLSVFTGVRPLVKAGNKATAALSRDHTVMTSPSGLVTITGGKWTTYRRMGAVAVDAARQVAGLPDQPSATTTLHLHGWQEEPAADGLATYGSDAPAVEQLFAEQEGWDVPLHPNLPYRAGEVIWAARHELARTVEDVLARRTRALLLDARASIEVAPRVAQLLAGELGFDEAWQQRQVAQYRELAKGYLLA